MDFKKSKRKGGAEKIRDKKRKMLESTAEKCKKITELFRSSIIKPSVTGICHSADSDSLALNTQERILQDKIVTAEPISMPGNINEVSEIENEASDLDFLLVLTLATYQCFLVITLSKIPMIP